MNDVVGAVLAVEFRAEVDFQRRGIADCRGRGAVGQEHDFQAGGVAALEPEGAHRVAESGAFDQLQFVQVNI